jgi:hypothetical protein
MVQQAIAAVITCPLSTGRLPLVIKGYQRLSTPINGFAPHFDPHQRAIKGYQRAFVGGAPTPVCQEGPRLSKAINRSRLVLSRLTAVTASQHHSPLQCRRSSVAPAVAEPCQTLSCQSLSLLPSQQPLATSSLRRPRSNGAADDATTSRACLFPSCTPALGELCLLALTIVACSTPQALIVRPSGISCYRDLTHDNVSIPAFMLVPQVEH